MSERDLADVEQGVPLCVGGPGLAVHLGGTQLDLPAWVCGTVALTCENIRDLRAGEELFFLGNVKLRLI